jgi:hypothetical protein
MLTSGSVDMAIQQPFFPSFAYNNTYGIQAIDKSMHDGVLRRYSIETGCGPAITRCRQIAAATDPENIAASNDGSNACSHAGNICDTVAGGYSMFSGVRLCVS